MAIIVSVHRLSVHINRSCETDLFIGGSLSTELTEAGVVHWDSHDARAGLSLLLPISDLQNVPGEDPGAMIFATKGCCVGLDPFVATFFSAHVPHCGTGARAPKGQSAPPWAIRALFIGYPPGALMEGRTRHALSAIPFSSQPLYITPEMCGVECVSLFIIFTRVPIFILISLPIIIMISISILILISIFIPIRFRFRFRF